ncbi:MAG: UDP-N-acetylglucosamine 2-epimerase (non-hydrolyzing) [Chloroflexota bacterium]|nr:MAG: UDP-N-acetylglucosamine 2-epimerase (non-hydrolyzing) [Chloroflexota bacterium]
MKVLTLIGTRPEIIRLSRVIPRLDQLCDHVVVHTGQNFDERLSDVFFRELHIREPDHYLGIQSSSMSEQIGRIMIECEKVVRAEQPDRLLILGDTNSGLFAVIAKRMGIPVYHMEAGNRCFDDRVPEEVNRRVIDHCSDVLMPYSERSRANLLREGIASDRIFVTGNPIKEVLDFYAPQIQASDVLARLGVEPEKYFLVTLHRAENVDIPERLQCFVTALKQLHRKYGLPVICSVHPRTRHQLEKGGLTLDESGIMALAPLGFLDFVRLQQDALCVLTDSGTVQEECCIMKRPNVTLRDVTERPETVEAGSNMLTGADPEQIERAVATVLSGNTSWTVPPEYLVPNVSQTVVKIVLGYKH